MKQKTNLLKSAALKKNRKFRIFAWMLLVLLGFGACGETKLSETFVNNNSEVNEDKDSKKITENGINTKEAHNLSGDLQVHIIDVGQGDSIFIQSAGANMLIDAGENDKGNIVTDYLDKLNIKKLDYVIGTHPHSDHIGGLDDIIYKYDIDTLLMPEKAHTTKTFEDVITAVQERNLILTKPAAGTTYPLGEAEFTIIAPLHYAYGDELNNYSIGIRLTHGNNSFVFTGDAEQEAEEDICKSKSELTAKVLKLGHHGSSTSTSEEFLKNVNPEYAVISCGKDNDYGHPHRESLELLKKYGVTPLRTDELGNIIFISDGKQLEVKTEKTEYLPDAEESEREEIKEEVKTEAEGEVKEESHNSEKAEEIQAENIEEEKHTDDLTVTYVLNINTHRFHRPYCDSVNQMKFKNRRNSSQTRDEIIEQGFQACKNCKP